MWVRARLAYVDTFSRFITLEQHDDLVERMSHTMHPLGVHYECRRHHRDIPGFLCKATGRYTASGGARPIPCLPHLATPARAPVSFNAAQEDKRHGAREGTGARKWPDVPFIMLRL